MISCATADNSQKTKAIVKCGGIHSHSRRCGDGGKRQWEILKQLRELGRDHSQGYYPNAPLTSPLGLDDSTEERRSWSMPITRPRCERPFP